MSKEDSIFSSESVEAVRRAAAGLGAFVTVDETLPEGRKEITTTEMTFPHSGTVRAFRIYGGPGVNAAKVLAAAVSADDTFGSRHPRG